MDVFSWQFCVFSSVFSIGLVIDLFCVYINLLAKYPNYASKLYIRAILNIQITNTFCWLHFMFLACPYDFYKEETKQYIGILATAFGISILYMRQLTMLFVVLPLMAYYSAFLILYQAVIPFDSILKVPEEKIIIMSLANYSVGAIICVAMEYCMFYCTAYQAIYGSLFLFITVLVVLLFCICHGIYCLLTQKNRSDVTKKMQIRGVKLICWMASIPVSSSLVVSLLLRFIPKNNEPLFLFLTICAQLHLVLVNIALVYIVRNLWQNPIRLPCFTILHKKKIVTKLSNNSVVTTTSTVL